MRDVRLIVDETKCIYCKVCEMPRDNGAGQNMRSCIQHTSKSVMSNFRMQRPYGIWGMHRDLGNMTWANAYGVRSILKVVSGRALEDKHSPRVIVKLHAERS